MKIFTQKTTRYLPARSFELVRNKNNYFSEVNNSGIEFCDVIFSTEI